MLRLGLMFFRTMKRTVPLRVLIVLLSLGAFVHAADSIKLRVALGGAHCEACTGKIRATLSEIKGVEFDPASVTSGSSPEYHSSRFQLSLREGSQTDIGDIARAVSRTETPHKSEAAPGLFLLLPWKVTLSRIEGSKLTSAVIEVPGVDAKNSFAGEIYAWVKLDDSGRARLAEIFTILSAAGIIDRPGSKESAGWLTDFEGARELARSSRKPLLIVFR
jgi:copper chaperone CopZ